MRRTPAIVLFLAAALGLLAGGDGSSVAQDKKAPKKKVEVVPPDDATKKQIADKTAALRKAIADLKPLPPPDGQPPAASKIHLILPDVEVFLKAAEWIVRHNEWLTNDAGKQTLRVLDMGLERAKHAAAEKAPWRGVTGKWVTLGYRSGVDGSVQPYAVVLPDGYGTPGEEKKYRMEIVLHGRDATLTEVKFLSGHEGKASPKGLDHIQLEVYGRGNNAYRWSGETDVFEAIGDAKLNLFENRDYFKNYTRLYWGGRDVLRGFSMGGAGTWHIGLHHPSYFAAISPGAGFTTTHGYVGGLPNELPPHVEKCLRIYDAVNYAENAMMIPVVAYSGEKDPQKKAADNIENALKGFKEPVKFTHLIAPGLEHQMPPEWQEKAAAEYRKYADPLERDPARVRLVTYTPKYGRFKRLRIVALEKMYERAVADAAVKDGTLTVITSNIRLLELDGMKEEYLIEGTVDGQKLELSREGRRNSLLRLEKADGKWREYAPKQGALLKQTYQCGPIDDAFMSAFTVIGSTNDGWHPASVATATARQREFAGLWDKYFRGTLPTPPKLPAGWVEGWRESTNLILFGDPQSNPDIAKVLPKLPITWTKDELVVNGVTYDPKTHLPVLIYPNPLNPRAYVVLNSGHTFGEADLKGTNALLYPRLGDWAVIKPTPTEQDPAAFEVVAAGLFDGNWQFPKK